MRDAFFRALFEIAERDERVTFITGDLGFNIVERFAELRPRQFLNAGVAEQNMTGIAAGLALCGKVVFTYSIGNFPTLRCLEQIRNDVCYHGVSVKIVAVGGGFAYGALGMTHHATEDLAIMRSLPGLVVVAPGDPIETALATRAIAAAPGPCYLRLGRAGEPTIHPATFDFQLGRAVTVREGDDLTLISTGGLLPLAVKVADRLSEERLRPRVLSMHTLKPLDVDAVLAAARETRAIVTLEEHSVIGGLGGAVAEVLAEFVQARVPFKRIGLPSAFVREVGDHDYLREIHGLTEPGVMRVLKPLLDLIRQ